jgi:uncharacterized secreted protein with C-terminal beta-propeller domain
MCVTGFVAAALVVSGCSATRPARRAVPVDHTVHTAQLAALTRFDDCGGLLSAIKREAVDEVGAYGLMNSPMLRGALFDVTTPMAQGVMGAEMKSAAGTGAVAAGAPGAGDGGFSTTNNQEAGVDEPDLTKTDGHLLVIVRHQPFGLQVMTVDGGTPHAAGFLELGQFAGDAQLFLAGTLAIVVGPAVVNAGPAGPGTVATVVNLADPNAPQVVRTFRVPGGEVDARMLAGRIVLVVQRWPDLTFRMPRAQGSAAQDRAVAHNRAVVNTSGLADWLPPVTTTPSHRTFAPACDTTWHSAKPQGVSTVDVVSFDPADESSVRQTTILGTAGVVYASTTGLYLATNDWQPTPMYGGPATKGIAGGLSPYGVPATTRIHAFDLHDPAAPRYVGSGVVQGQIVDQYSLSEYHGDLRVATTVGTATPAPGEGAAPKVLSDSRVTVLRPVGGALVQVGQLRGLGRGERIYGVRFLDDIGYVVTFRQIDPLYVLDLSDSSHPREVSHLEVTGYSAYLHPLGDGLLFGLGRRVNDKAHPLGEQLSVFDVSDPATPTLRSRLYEDNTGTPAEEDHHAFLWWAKDRLVVLPMYAENASTSVVAVYHVSDSGVLDRVGSVQPPTSTDYYGVERSLVIGGVLYVVGDQGVLASSISTLHRVAWIPFH